jgi:hypothetical protein
MADGTETRSLRRSSPRRSVPLPVGPWLGRVAEHAWRAERAAVPRRGHVLAREVVELDVPPVGRDDPGVLVEREPVRLGSDELDLRVGRLGGGVVEACLVRPDLDVPAVLDDVLLRALRCLDLHRFASSIRSIAARATPGIACSGNAKVELALISQST